MTATVAVTGAAGFIGGHIVEKLLSEGFNVRGLSRSQRDASSPALSWVQGTLDDRQALDRLLCGADAVIHCAGQVRGHDAAIFTRCNVDGSLNLMQAAQASGCRRFLLISSLAARYPQLSWYAGSKYAAEQQLSAAAAGMTLGIFRPTAVYGPGDRELKPVFSWLLRGLLPRLGAADARLSFLHVSDLAAAVHRWLLAAPPGIRTCELCDGAPEGYSWQRLRQIGAEIRRGPVRLIPVPLPLLTLIAGCGSAVNRLRRREPMLTRSKIRELTHPDWSAGNQDAAAYIGWVPEVSLERALREGLF